MVNFNISTLPIIIDALENKKTIGEFLNDQKMIDEVRAAKTEIIKEVCNNDPVIRARFNYLLSKQ